MKNIILILTLAVVFFSACQQENKTPPTISDLTILEDSILKEQGAQLSFSYAISDDIELSKFRVRVIDDFSDARLDLAPWFYENDFNVSGAEVIDTMSITLPYPDLETGVYKLEFTVADIDDNETFQQKGFVIY